MRLNKIFIPVLFLFLIGGCSSIFPCQNTLFAEVDSPDKNHKAIIFTRDCGATTERSYQVSILKKEVDLNDKEKGNLLIAEISSPTPVSPILINWNKDSVHIHINSAKEIFLQKDSLFNLPIKYTYGDGFDIK